eukprot:UN03638
MKLCTDFSIDNVDCYNAMMKAFCDQNQSIGQSLELFKQMEKNLIFPNKDTFDILLTHCIHSIAVKSAETIWQKMKEYQCIYDDKSYIAMIIIYTQFGDLDSVQKKFEEMQNLNVNISDQYKDVFAKYNELNANDKGGKEALLELQRIFNLN